MATEMKTVFVGNLKWSTTNEELQEFMSQCGNVVSADVQAHADSGRSKGWGLVEYSTAEEAQNAIQLLNSTTLQERQIHVRLDRSNLDETAGVSVFVGNLPWSTTSETLAELFGSYEPFDVHVKTNMAGRSRGFAILRFNNQDQANAAITDMNGYNLEERNIQVREDRGVAEGGPRGGSGGGGGGGRGRGRRGGAEDSAGGGGGNQGGARTPRNVEPSNTLFVGNLAWSTTDTELMEHFTDTSPISANVQVSASGRSKGWGLVSYETVEAAQAAIEFKNNSTLNDRVIHVRMDRNSS
uniref:RRM domain-containing protein n=1 Tax=Fibrocapsa japonica TaxID=94617 RepID=A0A7S2V6P6_9STRA|mmetsp:Transcript_5491/g.8294  ORF Transcript_5491/g.8294 Transcript_5491/m.8294 type:complete len:297 (+) Transcript_5491:214-1104(+)